jgi:hypothetical protein
MGPRRKRTSGQTKGLGGFVAVEAQLAHPSSVVLHAICVSLLNSRRNRWGVVLEIRSLLCFVINRL